MILPGTNIHDSKSTEKSSSYNKPFFPEKKTSLWEYVLVAIMFYLFLSTVRYRLIHPEQTETQLMFNLGPAIMWEK